MMVLMIYCFYFIYLMMTALVIIEEVKKSYRIVMLATCAVVWAQSIMIFEGGLTAS
jgi:hypothetical protein